MRSQAADNAASQPAGRDDPRFVRAPDIARVVKVGDTLHKMAEEVYGFVTEDVLLRVLRNNPAIRSRDTIYLDSVVKFPDVSDLRPADVAQKPVR
jgi:nucleoid-associated protein YgaU